jgi:hypothetical protein
LKPVKLARAARYHRLHGRPDMADVMELVLTVAGRCRVCGIRLTDPVSIGRGVGPDCWAKLKAAERLTEPRGVE